MTRKIVLHVGTQKTGTTSFQRTAESARSELARQGFIYPDASIWFGSALTHVHHRFSLEIARDPHLTGGRARKYRNLVRGKKWDRGTVLLSAETLHGHIAGRDRFMPSQFGENYWQRREEYVEAVSRFVDGRDVRVVMSIRSPDTFMESMYLESVKSRREELPQSERFYSGTWKEFVRDASPLVDYARHVDLWEHYLGPVTVVRLEDGDMVTRLFRACGVEDPPAVNSSMRNVRTDPRVALWLRTLDEGNGEQREEFGHSEQARSAIEDFGNRSLWESSGQRDEFLAQFSKSVYGPSYFPELLPLKPAATLTDVEESSLHNAWRAWKALQE